MAQRVRLDSSAIEAVRYDRKKRTLDLKFREGHSYRYMQLPEFLYRELLSAESAGALWNAVKDQFEYEKLDWRVGWPAGANASMSGPGKEKSPALDTQNVGFSPRPSAAPVPAHFDPSDLNHVYFFAAGGSGNFVQPWKRSGFLPARLERPGEDLLTQAGESWWLIESAASWVTRIDLSAKFVDATRIHPHKTRAPPGKEKAQHFDQQSAGFCDLLLIRKLPSPATPAGLTVYLAVPNRSVLLGRAAFRRAVLE
jgi:hypothetical protein